jgi:hypothetical protein
MDVKEMINSANEALLSVGQLEIPLDITQAEKIVLSQWVASIAAACYDRGFKDGRGKNE